MKKFVMAVFLLGITATTHAAWYEKNPDHCISLGLNYSGLAMTGETSYTASGLTAKQDSETMQGAFTLDGRFPVSDWITLNAAVGIIGAESTADETALLSAGKADESGVLVNLGIRWYIH